MIKGDIPKDILEIYNKIEHAKFEVYIVGGGIRNLIMKKPIKDWDLTTNATPEDILKIFPDAFYNNDFGTVGIPIDEKSTLPTGAQVVEITTYRTEYGFSNKRHPDMVIWGKNINDDLSRRDFTMNAIAMKIENGKEVFIDPYKGQEDIENRIIRCVGNPKERFKEDALRLMRCIRFASELDFDIDELTGKELSADSNLISKISAERIRDELLKIMASPSPAKGIMLLKESGLLNFILPELLEGIGVSQVRPGRHHTTDVFTHNLMSLKLTPSTDPIVRFATLLHDAGKPRVQGKDKDGLVIFYNHEISGAKLAYDVCTRLRFSKKDAHRIVNLIRWHMFTVNENLSDAGVRRFIRRIGIENVADMMDLRIGDRLGGGTQTAESWRLKKFKERVAGELAPKPFSINDLAIDGNDIMRELDMKPGPKIGEILQELFEEVDEDMEKNTNEYLLNRIKELK